jgi:regulator of protease activity HflC (stomatin/prohibitin superfamily)
MTKGEASGTLVLIGGGIVILSTVIGGLMWGVPKYSVWTRTLAGRGELAQAEYNRQIATLEAKAKMESAKMLADAEVIRAEGVAQANKIIGNSLRDNESYLWYLWVTELNGANMQVIYVPTEANLPILEAGKRPSVPKLESPQ